MTLCLVLYEICKSGTTVQDWLSCFHVCSWEKHPGQSHVGKERVYFSLQFQITSPSLREVTQGRNWKAGTWRQACLLFYTASHPARNSLHTQEVPQGHRGCSGPPIRAGVSHSGLRLSISMNSQDRCTHPHSNLCDSQGVSFLLGDFRLCQVDS